MCLQKESKCENQECLKLAPIDVKEIDLDRGDWLGCGNYGVIYKGYFQGTKVAVKEIPIHTTQKEEVSEVVSYEMRALHGIKHPNLVQYIGYALTKERGDWYLLLLLEYIDGNYLDQILYDQNLKQKFNMTPSAKCRIFINIALALTYLHDPQRQVVHGDVKPANIMISKSGKVKLCDLGMIKMKHFSKLFFKECVISHGSPAYMAPEQLLEGKASSTYTDVYAFGLTLYEIFHEEPICKEDNLGDLKKRLRSKNFPGKLMKKHDDKYYNLIVQCLQQEPSNRPEAMQILTLLNTLTEDMKPKLESK